jgi:hypothetical protein
MAVLAERSSSWISCIDALGEKISKCLDERYIE